MKTKRNIIYSIILLVILFPSCIDKDYNWDELDKTAAINIGSLPIGNVERLTIESLFSDDLRDQLKVGSDGILYLEYRGDIEIDDPVIEVPETDVVSISTITYELPGITIPLPLNETVKVVENDPVSYTISEPLFSDEDWEIFVTSVDFASCNFIMDVAFSELGFTDNGSTLARGEVEVEFPSNIELVGEASKKIKRTFNLNELNNGRITLPAVQLKSIDYKDGVQDLIYSVTIYGGSNTQLTAQSGSFKFDLSFRTENVIPDIIYGDVSFNQLTNGHIDDLKELNDAFTSNDVMKFDDIQFYLNMKTNLGANFTVGIDKLTTGNSEESVSIANVAGNKLNVTKPEINKVKSTSYVLAKNNPNTGVDFVQADITPLFGIIPAWLDYTISIHNDNVADKSAFYLYNRLEIEADYRIVVPFSFSELNLHLSDTLTNVFKDDLAENIFYEPGEFKVVANEAIVDFANTEAGALNLSVKVSILDENMNKIDVEVIPVTLTNGTHPLEIKIEIKEQDIAKLQRAMHLSFDFDVANTPGSTLSLRNTDSIEIRGIKFQSSSGVKFDLE